MAAKTNLSALAVSIEADIKNLTAGLKLAESQIGAFEKSAAASGASFRNRFVKEIGAAGTAFRSLRNGTLAVGALAVGLGTATQKALAFADNIGEMAARSGTAVDEFQRLSFAAQQGGASTEIMSSALAKLGKNIAEAVAGTEAGNKFLRETRLTLRDVTTESGNAREAAEVMSLIGRKMQDASSDAERLRMSFAGFGRGAGAALVPVMENLDEVKAKANVFTDEQVARAGKMNDELDQLVNSIKVELSKALISVGPELLKTLSTVERLSREVRMVVARAKGDDLSEDIASADQLQAQINGFKSDLRYYTEEFNRRKKLAESLRAGSFIDRADAGTVEKQMADDLANMERVRREISRREAEIRRRGVEEVEDAAEAEENAKSEALAAGEERRAAIREKWSKIEPEHMALGEIYRGKRLSDELNKAWLEAREEAAAKDYTNRIELANEIAEYEKKLEKERFERLLEYTDEFAQDFSRAFADAALEGEDAFEKIEEAFKRMLIEMATQELIARPLQQMFAGVLGSITGNTAAAQGADQGPSLGGQALSAAGGFIKDKAVEWAGGLFGSFFAGGGRPPMNRVSMVGERGPELFVPDQPGRVMPITSGSGGGSGMGRPQVNVSVVHQGGTTSSVQQKPNGDLEVLVDQLESKMAQRVGRGGKLASAVSAQTGTSRPPIQGIR